jgi:hypothetical protein
LLDVDDVARGGERTELVEVEIIMLRQRTPLRYRPKSQPKYPEHVKQTVSRLSSLRGRLRVYFEARSETDCSSDKINKVCFVDETSFDSRSSGKREVERWQSAFEIIRRTRWRKMRSHRASERVRQAKTAVSTLQRERIDAAHCALIRSANVTFEQQMMSSFNYIHQ